MSNNILFSHNKQNHNTHEQNTKIPDKILVSKLVELYQASITVLNCLDPKGYQPNLKPKS